MDGEQPDQEAAATDTALEGDQSLDTAPDFVAVDAGADHDDTPMDNTADPAAACDTGHGSGVPEHAEGGDADMPSGAAEAHEADAGAAKLEVVGPGQSGADLKMVGEEGAGATAMAAGDDEGGAEAEAGSEGEGEGVGCARMGDEDGYALGDAGNDPMGAGHASLADVDPLAEGEGEGDAADGDGGLNVEPPITTGAAQGAHASVGFLLIP
jgi:hypothetical protein